MIRTRLFDSLLRIGAFDELGDRFNLFERLGEIAGISSLSEEWGEDAVTLTGLLDFDAARRVEAGGFALSIGRPGGRRLRVPFTLELPRLPAALLLAGVSLHSGIMEPEEALRVFGEELVSDALGLAANQLPRLGDVSVQIGPLPAFLELPRSWLERGRYVRDAHGDVIGVERDPDTAPLRMKLGDVTMKVSPAGIDVTLSGGGPLTLPPVMIAGTDLAIELDDFSIRTADTPLPQELTTLGAARGFDESWRGIFARRVVLWNLDRVFPGGPAGRANGPGAGGSVTATCLAIDRRGITGEVIWTRQPPEEQRLALDRMVLAFDRNWYPTGVEGGGRLGLESFGAEDVRFTARMELDPFAATQGRWSVLIRAEGGTPGAPVVSFDAPTPALVAAVAALSVHFGEGDAGLLLGALAAGDVAGLLGWRSLEITSAEAIAKPVAGGGLAFEGRASFAANLEITAGNGPPQPLGLRTGTIELFHHPEDGAGSYWSIDDGLTLALPVAVDVGGAVTLDRVALRKRTDGALLIELGVDVEGTGDLVIGGMPNVMTLVYHPGPPPDFSIELSRDGQPLTLLVPGVLYATGTLVQSEDGFPGIGGEGWGSALRASVTAYLVGNGKAIEPGDHLKKESYLFAFDLGALTATRSDGMKALVLTGDLTFNPGVPLGATGTALYGLGLTYAQNAAPDISDGDFTGWFLERAPQFSTTASKWVPRGGQWGFGASVALGSQPDEGRAWNVAAGLFLLVPGPVVMLTGKGNLFSPPPVLPAGGEGRSVEAPFAAALALDFLRDRLSAELIADIAVTAGGVPLLELGIPAAVDASLSAPLDMELSIGRFQPQGERVTGRALGLYDITTYVVVTTRGIEGFPEPGRDLAPFATAFGGSGGLSAGFSSAIAELRLSVEAGFDLGVSFASPPLMVGRIFAEGRLIARLACVGVNLGIRTDLLVTAPDPFELSGTARIKVGLPWPLPDINVSGSFTIGDRSSWPEDYPHAENPLSHFSLFPRSNGTAVLEDGKAFDGVVLSDHDVVSGVPVDAGLLLAFRAPVGNAEPMIGMIQTQADDAANPVWEVATSGTDENGRRLRVGWRHVLTELRLLDGDEEIAALAGWSSKATDGTTDRSANEAPGGQAARTSLTLLAPLEAPLERRYGTGAEVLGDILEGWQPCARAADIKEMQVTFEVPPPVDLGVVVAMRQPPLIPPGSCGLLRRRGLMPGADAMVCFTGPQGGVAVLFAPHEVLPPAVHARPDRLRFALPGSLGAQEFVICLPAMVFARDRDAEAAVPVATVMEPPCGQLRIVLPPGGSGREVYFAVRRGVHLLVLDDQSQPHDAALVHTATIEISEDETWELRRVILPPETCDLRVHATHAPRFHSELTGTHGALFLGASFYADHEIHHEALARRLDASSRLVTELQGQAAGWAASGIDGLLRPGTRYTVEAVVRSHKARQLGDGPLEVSADAKTFRKIVHFETEVDIQQPLAPRLAAPAWADGTAQPWNVDTVPAGGAMHYRAEPIAVTMADAVLQGRLKAHRRSVSIRLTHVSGRNPKVMAESLLAQRKAGLAILQDIVSDYLARQPCLDAADPLWLSLVRRYDTLLEPGEYVSELLAVDDAGARPDKLLHRWRFKASRWKTRAAHVGAFKTRAVPRPGRAAELLARARARLGPASPELLADDMLLDALLIEDFAEPPALPADRPLLHIWVREDGIAGVLLDGPEPLTVPRVTITMDRRGEVPLHGVVSDMAGTRLLLLPVSVIQPGPLVVRIEADGIRHELAADIPAFSVLTAHARGAHP